MKPAATFRIDGRLSTKPTKNARSGLPEILVEVGSFSGISRQYYRIQVRDTEDLQGLEAGQRVRVEGSIFSNIGNTRIFLDLYADSVLPFAGEPKLPEPARQSDEFDPPPSGSAPEELGYGGGRRSYAQGGFAREVLGEDYEQLPLGL